MKKHFLLFVIAFLITENSFSQAGEWTWMNGPSTINTGGIFGTQGVSDPANHPPTLYEAIEWTDMQGNFWLYGGLKTSSGPDIYADLWKFNPAINEWTWINGSGVQNVPPIYGVKGVPNAANRPGSRAWGIDAWADSSGNLWMFGSAGYTTNSDHNDLWRYTISSNMWTWMSGDNFPNSPGNYGTMGVPSVFNVPPAREESSSAWVDDSGNFWLFGGETIGGFDNDLWKYNPITNEWAWMKGSNVMGAASVYGTFRVSDPSNTPGGRLSYSHWKDRSGNFWMFGGRGYQGGYGTFNDLWKFDLSINEWTWIDGTNLRNDPGRYGNLCDTTLNNYPACRFENKACWTDACGNFWLLGGSTINTEYRNDLWQYNPVTYKWNWIFGDSTLNPTGNFGSILISSPTNKPPPRMGSCSWTDNRGNLWLFGGGFTSRGDMWRYVPDPCCGGCGFIIPVVSIDASNREICPGTCLNFQSTSCNTASYLWAFPGGTPSSSTDVNPQNICYSTPGSYDVQLIATNANGIDTLLFSNYITVYPTPLPQAITQSGDTLFANAGAASYQWYFNGNIIPGATNYFYIAPGSGDYNLVATDGNGCEVEAAIFNVIANLSPEIKRMGILIYPNPVIDKLTIQTSLPATMGIKDETAAEIAIYNLFGEKIFAACLPNTHCILPAELDLHAFPPGIYFIRIKVEDSLFNYKLVKI